MHWDYIVPDGDPSNQYFKNAARNEQYPQLGQSLNIAVWSPLPHTPLPNVEERRANEVRVDAPGHFERLPKGMSKRFSKLGFGKGEKIKPGSGSDTVLKGRSPNDEVEYLYLEICHTPESMDIFPVDAGNGKLKRIAYLFLSRRESNLEERWDGNWSAGSRDWDWNTELEMRRMSII